MAQVLGSGELHVNALGLKYDANFSPQLTRVAGGIVSQDERASTDRHHERGKNSEHRGLAAAVRPQQSKKFGWPHVERYPFQCGAIVVAVHELAHRYRRWTGEVLLRNGSNCGEGRHGGG